MNPQSQESGQLIRINSGTILRTILFLLLFYVLYLLRDLLLVILTAVIIASAIEPMTRFFERHKMPRVIAVIIVYLFLAVVIALGFYFFFPPLLSDISYIISQLPQYTSSFEIWSAVPQQFSDFSNSLTLDRLVDQVQTLVGGAGAFGFAANIFGGLLSFVLIVVLSFYLAVQRDGVASFLRIVTPLRYEAYVIDLWRRTQFKIGRWLQGQLLLSLLVGILVYLGLMVLGVPNAFVLAILAGIFELIPLFGPVLAAVPAVAVALIDGSPSLALMVILLYVIIQQFENHLLHPLVVNKVVGVPPLVVIIALVVGAKLAGFIGIILAVPLAAAAMELMNDVEKRKKRIQELQETPAN